MPHRAVMMVVDFMLVYYPQYVTFLILIATNVRSLSGYLQSAHDNLLRYLSVVCSKVILDILLNVVSFREQMLPDNEFNSESLNLQQTADTCHMSTASHISQQEWRRVGIISHTTVIQFSRVK